MDKLAIANRLNPTGLRAAADAYREETRKRHRAEGKDKAEALTLAWQAMWSQFEPLVVQAERKGTTTPQLVGIPDDLDGLLDPNYHEADAGRRLRDGIVWAAEQIRRVVADADNATTIHLERATTPPPTAFAVFVVEHYARRAPHDRGELIARVMQFATKQHEPQAQGAVHAGEADSFLDRIGQ
jgi:hypothetical protein